MSFFKESVYRNKKYLKWVSNQDCVICGAPADDAHHIIGVGEGGMGTKSGDNLCMPVCRPHHTEIHENPELWPIQWKYVAKTVEKAINSGFVF